MNRLPCTVLTFTLAAAAAGTAHAAPPASCGTLNAGLQILTGIPSPAGGSDYAGALKMAVWYPTSAQAVSYQYSGPGSAISGLVAMNAAVASCAQFPLVIFSHGWSGCGTQSVFITEQLARLGYIVAAPDHNDHGCSVDGTSNTLQQINFEFPFSEFGDPSTWTDQVASYRDVDIETVLSYMLNTWTYKSSIDASKIAMSGHSFGGYTAFAKIGGWPSWLNTKFKAGLMYSPYIQAFEAQSPSTIGLPTVPQMYMTGALPDIGIMPWVRGPQPCQSPCTPQPGAFEQSQFLKYYGELAGSGLDASHLAFTNILCTDAGYSTVQSCLASDANAQVLVNYTQDFFEHFLGGQTPKLLWSTGKEWLTYWRTAGEPSGSYVPGAGAAPQEIVTVLGENLTTDPPTPAAGSISLPLVIGQTSATVTDAIGIPRRAPLYYVSPGQINLVIPSGTATGQATIEIDVSGNEVAAGPITIKSASPALFATSSNAVEGWAQNAGGYINITGSSGPVPLNVSDGATYLIALGTGLRGGPNSTAMAMIGNIAFDGLHAPRPVIAASPQFEGLDQIAVGPLPASLSGAGLVNVSVILSGQQSNVVHLLIQ